MAGPQTGLAQKDSNETELKQFCKEQRAKPYKQLSYLGEILAMNTLCQVVLDSLLTMSK